MILGAAIAKVSDSQIFCEWGDEAQPNLPETRSYIKNFLRERNFLNKTSDIVNYDKYSLYFSNKKTCVYIAIFLQTNNYGHVQDFIQEIEREFEEVRKSTLFRFICYF
jgi:predicted P-loop ATPase